MGIIPDSITTDDSFDVNMMFLVVGAVFCLGKTWMDVLILIVNGREWMKKKSLSPSDRILTFQGIVRICLGYMSLIWYILARFWPKINQIDYIYTLFASGFLYFVSWNVWLTASLCSYYCVKIVDFRHPFFIRLKSRLLGLVSQWLLGSAILSFAGSLPLAHNDLERRADGNSSDFIQNKNGTDSYLMIAVNIQYALRGLGYCVAFSICATSAVLLLFSLWRHHQRMLRSQEGHRSPRTDAHFRAVITIFALLVNHVVVFICVQLERSKSLRENLMGASLVIYICFSMETLITVWGNKKLKNELYRCLYFPKCRGCVRWIRTHFNCVLS